MRNFNTKLHLSFMGLIAFLLVSFTAPILAQEKHQTEDAPNHKIVIKKKIVTADGETKVIERVIEGDQKGIDLDEIDSQIQEIEVIRKGDGDQQEIIITTFGDNGESVIEIYNDDHDLSIKGIGECESPKIISIFGEGDHPGLFHLKRGMSHPGAHNLQVVTLKPGEAIPDNILEDIIEMGLDVEAVRQQVEAAERMVYISKEGESPALVEVDGDEPESLKGFMLHNNTEGLHSMPGNFNWQSKDGNFFNFDHDFDFDFDFDYDFDFDFNKEDLEHKFNFNFEGEMPENLKEKLLKEYELNIESIEDGQIRIVTPEGEDIIDLNIENDGDGIHFFKLNSEGNFGNLENLESLEDLDIDIDIKGLENLEGLNFLKNWDWNSSCDKAEVTTEEKPFLGVLLGESSEKGVFVDGVVEESAAEAAGLLEGDIITAINDNAVTNSDELVDAILAQKVGDQITVSYIREGNPATATATLNGKSYKVWNKQNFKFDHKAPHPEPHLFRDRSWFHNDVDCETLCNSPFLGVLIENTDENAGVNITDIFQATGAEKADLREDDVIMTINDQAMNDVDDVVKKVLSYKPGDVVTVGFARDGQRLSVEATLGTKANSGAYNPCDCETLELKKSVELQEIIILKDQEAEVEEVPEEIIEVPTPQVETPVENRTLQLRAFSLFPNPNNGNFTISFRAEKQEPITISVVDVSGREVYREEVQDFRGSYYQDINISQNSGGVYFLNIIQGDEIWTERFVYSNE
ncbi:MAG: PDZ domain-containing protein [Bacteroidota bacterium]